MTKDFDKILDECIDRINRGDGVADCLVDYPGESRKLETLLVTIVGMKAACVFVPSAQARSHQQQRFLAARVAAGERRERQQRTFPRRILGWSKIWAAAIAVIALGLIGFYAMRPEADLPVVEVTANATGNFVFLLSDEANAIGDFKELRVWVSKVSMRLSGDQDTSIEFEPGVGTVELTGLQGDRAQEIWRGNVPDGEYTKVVLEISQVRGVLADTGEEANIKLPGDKLQVSKSFIVEGGQMTNFVYDLTVVRAGKGSHYIIKPQVDQSGAGQNFIKVEHPE